MSHRTTTRMLWWVYGGGSVVYKLVALGLWLWCG